MKNKKWVNEVITGEVRFSYVNIFEPRSINGENEKYSLSLIIPKSDEKTILEIEEAIFASEENGRKRFGLIESKKLRTPLRDGDVEKPGNPVYKNSFFINAKSTIKPQIVDINIDEIKDKAEVYSGCYGRVSLSFYPYQFNNNAGVACSLGNVQKLSDGERLDLSTTAKDDFKAYDVDGFFS